MSSSPVFSTKQQRQDIADLLYRYCLLPFATETIPGAVMEGALGHVREAQVLGTYDFVDVVKPKERIGWQVKSTKASTPVTWKRAKLDNQRTLIEASHKGEKGLQALGDAIIKFCNDHAAASMTKYSLDAIGYSRLIVHDNRKATYFERLLCTNKNPKIFQESDFSWRWSVQKVTKEKEQLSALHGIHIPTKTKWFAWHGLGENQLHFSGEANWWPPDNSPHAITFDLPNTEEKLSVEAFIELLANIRKPN